MAKRKTQKGPVRPPGQGQSKKARARRRKRMAGATRPKGVQRNTRRGSVRGQTMSAPVQQRRNLGPNKFRAKINDSGDRIVVIGEEFMSNLSGTSTNTAGDVVYTFNLNPANTPSRLALICQCYELFKFTPGITKMIFYPNQGTNITGGLMAYWDQDPVEQVSIETGRNSKSKQDWNTWAVAQHTCVLNAPLDGKRKFYVDENAASDADQRLTIQAQFNVLINLPLANSATSNPLGATDTLGQVYLRYVCELVSPCYQPQISNTAAIAEVEYTYSSSTQINFNKQQGDWDLTGGNHGNIDSLYSNAAPIGPGGSSAVGFVLPQPNTTYRIVGYASIAGDNAAFTTGIRLKLTENGHTNVSANNFLTASSNVAASVNQGFQVAILGNITTGQTGTGPFFFWLAMAFGTHLCLVDNTGTDVNLWMTAYPVNNLSMSKNTVGFRRRPFKPLIEPRPVSESELMDRIFQRFKLEFPEFVPKKKRTGGQTPKNQDPNDD